MKGGGGNAVEGDGAGPVDEVVGLVPVEGAMGDELDVDVGGVEFAVGNIEEIAGAGGVANVEFEFGSGLEEEGDAGGECAGECTAVVARRNDTA